jgi:hypothetical protein
LSSKAPLLHGRIFNIKFNIDNLFFQLFSFVQFFNPNFELISIEPFIDFDANILIRNQTNTPFVPCTKAISFESSETVQYMVKIEYKIEINVKDIIIPQTKNEIFMKVFVGGESVKYEYISSMGVIFVNNIRKNGYTNCSLLN